MEFKMPKMPTETELDLMMPKLLETIPQARVYTPHRMANVITYHCFRNTELENIHVKHISDKEMMATMIETSAKVHHLIVKNKFWGMEAGAIVDYCLFSSFHNIKAVMPKSNLKKLRAETTRHIGGIQFLRQEKPKFFEAWVRLNGPSVSYWDKTTIWDGQKLRPRRGVKPREPGFQYSLKR